MVCGIDKKMIHYYASSSVFHAGTGKIPYCKSCLKDMVVDENGKVNIGKFKEVLKEIDKPYLHDVIQSAYRESLELKDGEGDIVGIYFKNINSLPQYRSLTWCDSVLKADYDDEILIETSFKNDFAVTSEMVNRWGKYKPEEYHNLEKFYWEMKDRNKIETPQEETYLKKLALISLKMDQELAAGNYPQARDLGNLFSKYMADSQFRAMDKTEADKTGGLRTFSQIYAEVEKDDFIPPWEYYMKIKGLKQDIVDKTIMYIANFILRLNKIEQMTEPPADTPKVVDE